MSQYTRAERLAQINRLLAQGLTGQQIADELGMSLGGVRNILFDPDGSKQKDRRSRYQGRCEVCGAATDGSNGRAAAPRRCFAHFDWDAQVAARGVRRWTPERVIEAAQEFARRYDRKPTSVEWNPALARSTGHPEMSERFYADGCWPFVPTVVELFGTWNQMLEAAGLPTNRPGQRAASLREAAL